MASSWDVQFFFKAPWDEEEGALITPQVSGQGSTALDRTGWPGINEAEAGCPSGKAWVCLQWHARFPAQQEQFGEESTERTRERLEPPKSNPVMRTAATDLVPIRCPILPISYPCFGARPQEDDASLHRTGFHSRACLSPLGFDNR